MLKRRCESGFLGPVHTRTERNGTDQNETERNFLRGVHTAMDRFEVLISSSLEI